jgi:hypothetical protein
VIAEIELPEELAVLTEMGVDLVRATCSVVRRSIRPGCPPDAAQTRHSAVLNDEGSDLSALLNEQPAVNRDTPTARCWKPSAARPTSNSLAVLDEHQPRSASSIAIRCPTPCSNRSPPTCSHANRSAA